ncbi:MAG: mannose-1-phosphate guanylyltransferase/mannose-6-phosphate isomerase [Dissulfurispiraceae bacterium]
MSDYDTILIVPTILSGGSGTRLWPVSREHYPKQLLPLITEETLLQSTAKRLDGISSEVKVSEEPIVVSNEEYRFIIAEQLRTINKISSNIILEPFGRNTAPALTLAVLRATNGGADPILLVMPSDHIIEDCSAFQRAVLDGISASLDGAIVTFGIVPSRPETGYGYIKTGRSLQAPVKIISAFVEKPDHSTAEQYFSSGEYLWNSGIFMVKASVWLKAMDFLQPQMLSACRNAYSEGRPDNVFYRVDRKAFSVCPSESIDYAVMEKLIGAHGLNIQGVVVPLAAGWSDVGSWDSVWSASRRDENGNAVQGDVILEGTRDSLVYATDRLVACIGLNNTIVVETPDAVMVADKDHVQEVKQIVSRLKENNRSESRAHRKVYRPWGCYDSIDLGDRFQVKRIIVNPGAVLSLQMHHHRAEHWIVVRGTAKITRDNESFLLSENQSTYIPIGARHRLENPGKLSLELIEVQSGSYLGEDDIVRFDDLYGRENTEL